MTLGEFLDPVHKGTHQARVLAVLYYYERYQSQSALTVDDIRDALKRARVRRAAKVNVADVLAKAGACVDTVGTKGTKKLWSLTETGRRTVRETLGLPAADIEVEHDVGTLERIIRGVKNTDVKDYLEEAMRCLKVDALRAAVVFVWSAAIRTIQERLLTKGGAKVTDAARKHDPRVRTISSIDHFAYVRDETVLLAGRDLGEFDKHEKDTLKEALDLRNRCGHPGKYRPGVKKVSSFIEDIVSIVFG